MNYLKIEISSAKTDSLKKLNSNSQFSLFIYLLKSAFNYIKQVKLIISVV